MTLFFWEIKKERNFNSKLDSYETKTIFIGRRRLPLRGGRVANAQLFIHIYPSQDNYTSETLWIFSGSSTANQGGSLRTSTVGTGYSNHDSWQFSTPSSGNIYVANKPSDTNFQLSPLFTSSNTNDIRLVRERIPGGGQTNITFAANATNTPTVTIGSGSRTISHIFMDDDNINDDMGIRVSSSLTFFGVSSWVGSGIINKPIGDFLAGTFHNGGTSIVHPNFAANSQGSLRLIVNSQFIPEPEEYALIFSLFALGFVFFHRRITQKKRR